MGHVVDDVTPSVAADILRRHRLRAGRRHGQHFLVDPNTVRKIVRLADISADETILEIGPGIGSLTVELAKTTANVVAIEIDESVVSALREVIGDAPNVTLRVEDAMSADLAGIGDCRLIANLPYNVATPLFIRILSSFPNVRGGLVMVQKELGERWIASPGSHAYNAVSVRVAYHSDARIVSDVPRTVFMPPPKVSSVLVAFDRREVPPVDVGDEDAFFRFVQKAFAHRRKTLRNSLVASGFERDDVERVLAAGGVEDKARPEDISLDLYARLHRSR
jgi:16S rRNA (adenine1518-N6/adenine1519-N6)-dimethyltransferase